MILFKQANDLKDYLQNKGADARAKGFVPTMGALHEGHLSLLSKAKENTDLTIVSIFVNPTQFNDPADFNKYPVTIERDMLALERSGCDILFLPAVEEIYPGGTGNLPVYPLGYLETVLEGKYRPGHFQGVCQVMHRLLEITEPDVLFLGQKDYQQCLVIKMLIKLEGMDIKTVVCPILRSEGGLALSSRNRRLTEEQKMNALAIYRQLNYIKNNVAGSSLADIINHAKSELLMAGFSKIDYVAIADYGSLEPVEEYDPEAKLVALVAAWMEDVRLIDNMLLTD